jgi:hypothetical protein
MTRALRAPHSPINDADASSSLSRFWLALGQGSSDARRQPCHDDLLGIVAVGANGVRLDDFRRKGGSLFLILSFITRKQHPFADDFAPQVVFGSHLDLPSVPIPEGQSDPAACFVGRETPFHEAVTTVM